MKEIDLEIKKKSLTLIIGPSGSGKSTLLNLASLMDTPTRGKILIRGKDTSKMSKSERIRIRRNQIGIIYQRDSLLPYLTILENVMVPMVAKDQKKAVKILKIVGLSHISKFPDEISRADQQRVALSRAVINNPSLLLADEPTGELNSEDTEKIINLIKDVGNKCAVLIASNNPDLGKYCDNILSLKDGILMGNPN
ncbi:MAG: ATP-binding cassette domain-containing protein [Methanobacteriaceae archaeon]|nr:ATP-binding cassette domain-containing protein [Methanobacteriaceae archaeon]